MPVFEYRGLSASGKQVTGLLEADSSRALRSQLKKAGVFLTDVLGQSEARTGRKAAIDREVQLTRVFRGRVSTEDVAVITRQLSTLLHAGVTLVEGLSALIDQTEKDRLKRTLSDVKQRVNEGSSLADALAQHPRIFGTLYVNMVRAGEASGALDAVLARLADFTEGQARLKQKLVGTLIYPAIMTVIGGGILVMLMTVVVPKVTRIFETMRATLPWTTRGLIFVSNLLSGWWWLLLPLVLGGAAAAVAWTRSPRGRPVFDAWVLRLPVAGTLLRMLLVSRFSRTLATLLKAGVPMLTAMDITRNVVTNTVLAGVVETARDAIREGESIAGPLKRSGQFPPLVYHMVAVGERSGQLEDMLLNVADSYENQVNVRLGALTALLEPLIIVAMGAVIAFVAFSILMPILQINTTIR
ncbi:MAG TPA: type II secretion system inner membrane protein GspF [Myxococcaceae bacterium]|jgi:general secretion pathway protein F|nr:type II secretion system inner membrane protein GspF [Myxococcaceae bacterium]